MRRPWLGPLALLALAHAATACSEPRPFRLGPGLCDACHGSGVNAAPPSSLLGQTSPTAVEVGAHQLHLRDTEIRRAIDCSECHRVPSRVQDPGHIDERHATLTWGPLATARGRLAPSWDRGAATCASTYCHGSTLRGGSRKTPVWTYVTEPSFAGPPAQVCASCHGWPPPAPHPDSTSCQACHPLTMRADGTIDVAGGYHIDGRVDFGGSGTGCASCHGAPPATGAHLAHHGDASSSPLTTTYGDTRILEDYQPSGAAHYLFGCGNCHPIDPARHLDGTVEVELWNPAAPAGSVKARSPSSAAYAGNGGACSNVYCHSSGQENPAFVASPGWTSGSKLGCTACHDNPPRYPSGGAGTATANTHLVLADDGYELGHFAGLPGPWHTSKHGGGAWGPGQDAAPITCQTCHYETVDPTNTGPSGFYYLDTGGNYQLPGGQLDYSCTATCHTGAAGKPPTGTGKVLPLRHVNGKREVVFDPRTTLPPIAWLPAAPNTPTRPYWATGAPPGYDPPAAGYDGTTWSLALGSAGGAPAAGYAPSTKTCSNVACHLNESRPPYPLVWGTTPVGNATCNNCHRF